MRSLIALLNENSKEADLTGAAKDTLCYLAFFQAYYKVQAHYNS